MDTATSQPSSKKKRLSKWLKVCGGALLLLAFGMQTSQNANQAIRNGLTDVQNFQIQLMEQASVYEGIYFAAKASGLQDLSYLKEAAMDYRLYAAAGMGIAYGKEGLTSRDGKWVFTNLTKAYEEIHDLDSYRKFVLIAKGVDRVFGDTKWKRINNPGKSAVSFGHLYLALYIIGSITALISQVLSD